MWQTNQQTKSGWSLLSEDLGKLAYLASSVGRGFCVSLKEKGGGGVGVKKGGRGTWALDRQCKYSGMCPQQEICSDSGFCAKLKILGEEVRNLRRDLT